MGTVSNISEGGEAVDNYPFTRFSHVAKMYGKRTR